MGRDPYEYFRVEAREIIEGLGRGALQLEKGASSKNVAELLRLAHTLKGAARVVKRPGIAESAHAIEGLLADLGDMGTPASSKQTSLMFTFLDAMATDLAAIDGPPPQPDPAGRPNLAEETTRSVQGDVAEIDALLDGIAEARVQMRTIRRTLGSVARARSLADLLVDQLAPGVKMSLPRFRSAAGELRELVSTVDRQLGGAMEQADREMRELRDGVERLRLAPAGSMFVSLERTVRDVGQSLGRETKFEASGAEVRLDAHVVAALQGALVQLVRNAVAHGIEPPIERTNAGKPSTGTVQIAVEKRGGRVVFVCRDDGRGVDLEAVRHVAERRGLLRNGAPPLDAAAVLKLLLKGGLTTSKTVTEHSGRGIGLDVVRAAVARLGGEVTVESNPGRGTTFELEVPLSLSSLDALIVEVAGVSAAIPLDAVRRTVHVTNQDIGRTSEGETVMHDGQTIPFMPLARPLGGKATPTSVNSARFAVVIHGATALAAVGVDRLLETANIVIRPLPRLAPADRMVMGIAIDADGTPQLVLDPTELVAAASRAGNTSPRAEGAEVKASILVIDDSLTTRMLEQSILESAGYEVDLATSAEEGLERARQKPYRLFLVDVEMPGMDGFTFVATARADPGLREVPAILVTSRNAPEDRRRGRDAGARGYVVKGDFDQGQLLALIRELVA
jgi:two-component system chemotaxis sensor kinase CheA